MFEASAYDVIRWLGHSTNAGTRRALGAYSSAEDVGLLRAWEYTLAAHASAVNVNEAVDSIAITALFGHSMPEYPHLRSPAAETGTIYARRLSEHPLFRHAPVQEIAEQLFTDVRAEISRRFYLEFDPGRKTAGDTRPAFGGYGGWVLCDLGVPSGKKSIRTAEAFQTARRSSAIRPGSVAIWTG